MKNILFFIVLSIALTVSLSSYAQNENGQIQGKDVKIKNYVVDEVNLLTLTQRENLISKLKDFDKRTTTQIVVYIINNLKGREISDLAWEIAEANKIGRKDKNNGVLMLIAYEDRKIWITVGYGLEPLLTDAYCHLLVKREITPRFKNGKYYEGIDFAVNDMMNVAVGEFSEIQKESKEKGFCLGVPFFVFIFLVLFAFIFVFSFFRSIFGFGSRIITGRKSSYWSGGGFWSGFGGSSGGFSGGGFSGGGGSFGGGGAGGSW
ncbi:MAG: TPM domain-containing protein [Ignavibacteria bacterium]|nr:TPM domain-containing protein [Ignavibacteria bacterium]